MNSVGSPDVVAVEEPPWVSGHGEKPGVERRSWLRQSGESTGIAADGGSKRAASRARPPRLQLLLCNPRYDHSALLCTSQLRVSESASLLLGSSSSRWLHRSLQAWSAPRRFLYG